MTDTRSTSEILDSLDGIVARMAEIEGVDATVLPRTGNAELIGAVKELTETVRRQHSRDMAADRAAAEKQAHFEHVKRLTLG